MQGPQPRLPRWDSLSVSGAWPILRSILHPAPHSTATGVTAFVLLDILLVVVLARLLGTLANRFGQPRAVGEIIAGILLGPTLIGHDLSFFIAPREARPALSAIATLALVLFMFLVGVEFDRSMVKGRQGQAVVLGLLSVAIPVAAGVPVAIWMHGSRFAGPNGASLLPFVLFVGACLSVTALPVIAHVLLERGELNTRVGGIGLAASGVASVAMFSCVGLASVVTGVGGFGPFLVKLLLIVLTGGGARFLIRPVLRRVLRRNRPWGGAPSSDDMTVVFAGLLLSALVADRLGVNAMVGAFAWGVVIPADPGLRRAVADRLSDAARVLLLPVFFAYSGLFTDLRLLTPSVFPVLVGVLMVAVATKLVAALPARLYGMTWREAGALGALMNTRGLVLLVVGLIGLNLHVITQAAFTIFVVVALATNLMTGPLLDLLGRRGEPVEPSFAQVAALTESSHSR